MHFIFKHSVDPSCSPDEFFHPEIFDYLPFDEEAPDQGEHSPSTLHLSGYAKEWMDKHTILAPYKKDLDVDDDDSSIETTSTTTTTSASTISFDDSTSDAPLLGDIVFSSQRPSLLASPELESLLIEYTKQPVELTPKSCRAENAKGLADLKLYLRRTNLQAATTTAPQVFPVLIDTGCSVACNTW